MLLLVWTLLAAVAAAAARWEAPAPAVAKHRRQSSGVNIVNLSKNVTVSSGTGNVAAAGTLGGIGGIGMGCGVNWAENSSFGGGLQAGSQTFGLGTGLTVTESRMDVGLGASIIPFGASTNVTLTAMKNGTISVVITSNNKMACAAESVGNVKVTRCTGN